MREYKIPSWCDMPKDYHEDGVGGCWGISCGYVEKQGENYCKNCWYRKEPSERQEGVREMKKLTKKEIQKICKKHFLDMWHPAGTIEADMIRLVNEIARLRGWK